MLPEYWGQGFATEAVEATFKYAREELGIERIVGEVAEENIASNKLLGKLGFRHVDTYVKDGFTINRYE